MPSAAKYIYSLSDSTPEMNLVQKLQRILANKDYNSFNSIIFDSAARIQAFLISEHYHYTQFLEDNKMLIGFIITNSL